MRYRIDSASLRVDDEGKTLRCLIHLPDLDSGLHGVQVSLPTTKDAMEAAIRRVYQEEAARQSATATVISTLAAMLDRDVELRL